MNTNNVHKIPPSCLHAKMQFSKLIFLFHFEIVHNVVSVHFNYKLKVKSIIIVLRSGVKITSHVPT